MKNSFIFAFGLALMVALDAHAGPANDTVAISDLDPITVNAWVGATSDLVGSDIYCTIACRGKCDKAANAKDYETAAYTLGATDGAGNFYLSNGGNTMLVYLDFVHPVDGTVRLTNNAITGATTGAVTGAYDCAADPNSQVRLDMVVPASEIATAAAGTYSETFQVDACLVSGGGSSCAAAVDVSVTLPELVEISRLDNLNLGTWDGASDVQETENFCVFRNGSGGFAISINSANAAGGTFNLVGSDTAPYQIELSQGGGYVAVTPGVTLSNAATGFNGSTTRNCGGSDNTTLRVSVDSADLSMVSTGTVGDTIVIIAEPN